MLIVGDILNRKAKRLYFSIKVSPLQCQEIWWLPTFIFTWMVSSSASPIKELLIPILLNLFFLLNMHSLILCVIYTTLKVKMPTKSLKEFHEKSPALRKEEKEDKISYLSNLLHLKCSVVQVGYFLISLEQHCFYGLIPGHRRNRMENNIAGFRISEGKSWHGGVLFAITWP